MNELEPKIGNVADIFKINTDKRVCKEYLDKNTLVMYEALQDELFNALRILENAIEIK